MNTVTLKFFFSLKEQEKHKEYCGVERVLRDEGIADQTGDSFFSRTLKPLEIQTIIIVLEDHVQKGYLTHPLENEWRLNEYIGSMP